MNCTWDTRKISNNFEYTVIKYFSKKNMRVACAVHTPKIENSVKKTPCSKRTPFRVHLGPKENLSLIAGKCNENILAR